MLVDLRELGREGLEVEERRVADEQDPRGRQNEIEGTAREGSLK